MSLRADVDCILEMRGPEHETAPVELAQDTLFFALFTTPITPLLEPSDMTSGTIPAVPLRERMLVQERRSGRTLRLQGEP